MKKKMRILSVHFEKGNRRRGTRLSREQIMECLICLLRIESSEGIWNCGSCRATTHIHCIDQWSLRSGVGSWYCIACRSPYSSTPIPTCYCGAVPHSPTHSCNQPCNLTGGKCIHTCSIPCHPGSCPPCTFPVFITCYCGRTESENPVDCCHSFTITGGKGKSVATSFPCALPCNSIIPSCSHQCFISCHPPPCECQVITETLCHCRKNTIPVKCGEPTPSCTLQCNNLLSCSIHYCKEQCHDGDCQPCTMPPPCVLQCPCGKTTLNSTRPGIINTTTCSLVCQKYLECNRHQCMEICHTGECPPCSQRHIVPCDCGKSRKEVSCSVEKWKCDEPCEKMSLCKKHKCMIPCCEQLELFHARVNRQKCIEPCGKTFQSCQHKCKVPCHKEKCPPCEYISYEEIYCPCKRTLIYPPNPCKENGNPDCPYPCTTQRVCGHVANHNCHLRGECPPCSVLTKKECWGGHKEITVQCYRTTLHCGELCGKLLGCGEHTCQRSCHKDKCSLECTNTCNKRRDCDHHCKEPCHKGTPCGDCTHLVPVSCKCGGVTEELVCGKEEETVECGSVCLWKKQSFQIELLQFRTLFPLAVVTIEKTFGEVVANRNQSEFCFRGLTLMCMIAREMSGYYQLECTIDHDSQDERYSVLNVTKCEGCSIPEFILSQLPPVADGPLGCLQLSDIVDHRKFSRTFRDARPENNPHTLITHLDRWIWELDETFYLLFFRDSTTCQNFFFTGRGGVYCKVSKLTFSHLVSHKRKKKKKKKENSFKPKVIKNSLQDGGSPFSLTNSFLSLNNN